MLKRLMRESLEDKWGIIELQNCILNIAEYIDRFCHENNIDYYLMGGSALGAIRHNGFIPWDDDLDIFMTLDNYEKFRKVFLEKGDNKNYYLHELGALDGKLASAKIRYNNSTLIEDVVSDMDIHHGVFVDIFILHNCPRPQIQRYWQYFWCRYIVVKGLSNRKNIRGNGLRRCILSFFKLLPKRFLLGYALKQVYKYRNCISNEYCHFLGRASISRGVYKKAQFDVPKRVPFETIEMNVPSMVEEYLHDRFGDYMKIPNIEEIRYFQHASHWDVNKPFLPRKQGVFGDEKYLF